MDITEVISRESFFFQLYLLALYYRSASLGNENSSIDSPDVSETSNTVPIDEKNCTAKKSTILPRLNHLVNISF